MIDESLRHKIIHKLTESVVGVKYFEANSFEKVLVCSGGTTFKIRHYPNCKYSLTINHSEFGETSFQISKDEYDGLYELYQVKFNEAMIVKTEKTIELLLQQISL